MADYIPVFKPGTDVTFTAGAAITGGRLVALSAAETVIETSATTAAWMGAAVQDAASGAMVGVTSGGVQELIVNAAVAVGDILVPAANGRVTPIAAGTNYAHVVGIATTAQSTAGQTCRVKMAR
ncbi:capsid cement protein [Pseudonocardia broussonetiae]|uniref:DUF2190 family protein n=1 Tax=Pseudonocardia broussonetiae TaxID=2736640 RepID=A0A6M6JJ50_9PSEU|nr:capsid cement protein [Pseudonocardia broussonetiae]QJY46662.1 DUF2190 family protein [Pseudonocardia broussonetiae]